MGSTEILGFLKSGALYFILGSFILSLVIGSVGLMQTGNPKPLLDTTIGMLLNGDNVAFQMEKDLFSGKTAEFPFEYKALIEETMIQKIFVNIFLSLVILVLLFKVWSWIFGSKSMESYIDVASIFLSIITYCLLSVGYKLFDLFLINGTFTINMDVLMSAIPLKALGYGIWHIPQLLTILG